MLLLSINIIMIKKDIKKYINNKKIKQLKY